MTTLIGPRLSPPGGAYQTLTFQCPRCGLHDVQIDIWHGPYGDHTVRLNGMPPDQPTMARKRLWHATQDEARGFDSLTVTPSIDRTGLDPCGGWHGHIKNGRTE